MLKKCQNHLDTVHESYVRHMRFAFGFGGRMIGGGIAAILHGILPAFFETTGSRTVFRLHDELKARSGHNRSASSGAMDGG